jgi:hypothetical protein
MDLNLVPLLAEPAGFLAGIGLLRLPVETVREWRVFAIRVLAVASGVGAVAAGGSPTGWQPLDLVLVGALGAVAVLAGAKAPAAVMLVCALPAAAAGLGGVALPLALGAIGLLLVGLIGESEPIADAAAAGLVTQAALRLQGLEGRGLTAFVAMLILVPLLVSAAYTLEHRHRRRLVRVFLGGLGFAVVGAMAGGVAAASSVGPLRSGLSVANATVDSTSSVDMETTSAGLADAKRDFGRARGALDAWWTIPARLVPGVAQHWRVLHAAAVTGDELAAAGQRAIAASALGDVQVVDGRVPLEALAAIEPPVADVAARATAARRRLDAARSFWLLPPLFDKLESELDRIRDMEGSAQLANRVLPMVPRLLGQDGSRRYFLAVQTPAEARAGGGFIGSFGEIVATDGRLSLTRFGRQDDLTLAPGRERRTLEGPEDFLARYGRFAPQAHWGNVNLSPDFPTDAQVIAELYPQSGGAPIDGVIAIDPAGLAALLGIVGPVEVPSWPTPISAVNALQVLLLDQYQGHSTRVGREDFLGDVAQVVWQRLTSGALPPVPQLISAFAPAVRAKHLLLSSIRPEEQRLFHDMGAAGGMAPVAGDFLGLITQNAAGNKIDYFLRREVEYRAELDPENGRLQASARIVLHNDAPAEGLDHGVIGNDLEPRLPTGTNKLYLSFYTPWRLVAGRVDGANVVFEQQTELGRQVYSAALVIPPKSRAVVELTLSGRLPETRSYRLDLHAQPLVNPDAVTVTLALDRRWRTAGGADEQTWRQRLESDVTLESPVRRR